MICRLRLPDSSALRHIRSARRSRGRWGGCRLFCGAAGVHEIAGNAIVHEKHALAGNAFAIERRTELVWMIDVVGNGDVFSQGAACRGGRRSRSADPGWRWRRNRKREKPTRSRTAAGSRMTVYLPGASSEGFSARAAFSLAVFARACGSKARKSAALAFAQLVAEPCCMVTENSAWVWR